MSGRPQPTEDTDGPGGNEILTLPEYRALLAGARAMVVALRAADGAFSAVRDGNPPLRASEVQVFRYWRDKTIETWNGLNKHLQDRDPVMLLHALAVLSADLTYPLTDVRSDWDDLAPEWSAAYFTFCDHLAQLKAIQDRPGAEVAIAAHLPLLATEFRPVPPC
jgi:hypothetical protein